MSDQPIVGRIIPEPSWQISNIYPVPLEHRQQQTFSSTWSWSYELSPELLIRLNEISNELWGKNQNAQFKCTICLSWRDKQQFHPLKGCNHRPYCAKCVGKAASEEIHGKGTIIFNL